MSTEFKGFIAKLSTRESPPDSKKKWTLYSVKIEKADGTEYEQWVSLGFDDPGVKEGDYVKLQATEENGRTKLVEGSLKKASNPPARTKKEKASGGGKSNYSKGGYSGGGNKFDGTGISNRTNPEDAKRMSFANARSSAIELIIGLLGVDGLPMSKAATKAGEAKRYDEVTAAVDKLTVKFYNDGMTLRLLDTVADTATDTKPDGELPDKESEDDGDAAEDNGKKSKDVGDVSGDADEFADDEGFED